MHLLVHLRHKYIDGVRKDQLVASFWLLQRNGGGGDVEVEDHEIYMKLQFPSIIRMMTQITILMSLDPYSEYSHQGEYDHRYKVNMMVESLRFKSDPLYFKPFVATNYVLYKSSP